MRITCPSCEATYEVPDRALRVGRKMRCARCGNNWAPLGEEPAPEAASPEPAPYPDSTETDTELFTRAPSAFAPPTDPEPTAAPEPTSLPPLREAWAMGTPTPPPKPAAKGNPALAAAWAASFGALALLAFAFIHYRTPIMAAWPPSIRLYSAIGLT